MMNKRRTRRVKYFIFLALAVLLLMISIKRIIDNQMPVVTTTVVDILREDGLVIQKTVYSQVEQMPQFHGGALALTRFFDENLKYPENAAKNKKQGRVIIQFIVDEEGNVISPEVVFNLDPELDAEAIRMATILPKWTPAKQKRKNVAVYYTVPIMFKLPEDAGTDTHK